MMVEHADFSVTPSSDDPVVAVVVPCYNEEGVLPRTNSRLVFLLSDCVARGLAHSKSFVCYVDDGSRDRTWAGIQKLSQENSNVRGVKLSRNFGHQAALMAGLQTCTADVYITIDADLQDDEEKIPQMLEKYRSGAEIVFGIRRNRSADTFFKRYSAECFYWILAKLGVEIHPNHADFRLMSRKAVSELQRFPERNLFLRALVLRLGYKTDQVFYDRKKRVTGESKYPTIKMLKYAWDGIASFSILPIRIVSLVGISMVCLSLVLVFYTLFSYFRGEVIRGWSSLMMTISFLGGFQLLAVGIIGEYIGKIYDEVKGRPIFIVEAAVGNPSGKAG